MSIIKRSDGVQFVMQSYRELLMQQPMSMLKRELRSLAQKQGEYVCCFKRVNSYGVEQFEAAFSRELGYLLGESVWHHFNRVNNLIWCEATSEENHVFLVVVKAGSIYVDAKVSYCDLAEEIATLTSFNDKYEVYVHGNVPLVNIAHADAAPTQIFLSDENISSFNVLSESILPRLALIEEFKLQPLPLVLTSVQFKNKYIMPILVTGAGILLLLLFGQMFFTGNKKDVVAALIKDPYVLYNDALTTPVPQEIFGELGKVIALCSTIGGWSVENITFSGDSYVVQMKAANDDGNQSSIAIQQLQLWAKKHNVNMVDSGANDIVKLAIPTKSAKRPKPSAIYNLSKVVNLVIMKMQLAMAKENIVIGAVNNYGKTKSVEITLNIQDFSPFLFNLLGKLMAGMPIGITNISLSETQNLFSGIIKVTIWGN